MRAANERGGEFKDEISRLENEVATWRSRRTTTRQSACGRYLQACGPAVRSVSGPNVSYRKAVAAQPGKARRSHDRHSQRDTEETSFGSLAGRKKAASSGGGGAHEG